MRRARYVVLGIVLVLVVVAAGGYFYERPLLLTGTGYAAHNACALKAIAGRDDAKVDLPPNPLVPVLRTKTTAASAKASILGVLAKQQAWATPGYGCTLADHRPKLDPPTKVSSAANPYTSATPPAMSTGVKDALSKAFGDDLSTNARKALGTRGVVVLKDGRLVAERYAQGFGPTTPQLGWSMTKSVTDLIAGRLVDEGKLSLDQDHLRPEWKDGRAKITVRELLQMTSGLKWDEDYSLGTTITTMLYLKGDMGSYVASQPLAHKPGTVLQYSTGSPTLLCSVIAKSDGGADFPRRELFAPLGLSSAVLEPDAVGTPVCGSYMWATPRDWAAVGEFALADGVWGSQRLLPAGWMKQSTTAVKVAKSDSKGYATGWWANQASDGSLVYQYLPADAYFAEGHDGQWLIIVPSQQLVIARLGFTPTAKHDRAIGLAEDLIKALG
jgi:CubicO group peptidase (beta-lactamase class C family)